MNLKENILTRANRNGTYLCGRQIGSRPGAKINLNKVKLNGVTSHRTLYVEWALE